jgi:hypothetical protein
VFDALPQLPSQRWMAPGIPPLGSGVRKFHENYTIEVPRGLVNGSQPLSLGAVPVKIKKRSVPAAERLAEDAAKARTYPYNNGPRTTRPVKPTVAAPSGLADGKLTGYTRHGLNQAIGREGAGVAGRAILDAIKNPTDVVQQSGGRIKYIGRDAGVVVNKLGKVITTWPRGSGGLRGTGGAD